MTNKTIFSGMLALILTFGLVLAGCDMNSDNSSIPPALIGEWASKATPGTRMFEITSAGKFFYASGESYDVSVSGNTVELKVSGNTVGIFNYSISNGELIVTNATSVVSPLSWASPFVKYGLLSGTISITGDPYVGATLTAVYTGNEPNIMFRWFRNGAIIAGEIQDVFQPAQDGTYYVTVTAPGYDNIVTSAPVTITAR